MRKPNPKNKTTVAKKQAESSYIDEIVGFVDKYLPKLFEETIYEEINDFEEDTLTEFLLNYFIQQKNDNFYFVAQAGQKEGKRKGSRRKVDIAIALYQNNNKPRKIEYIFCIEAKNLPTKDYVKGNYAALKRFKANEHGLNNSFEQNPLPQNGIIAYVKTDDYSIHYTTINNEIQELSSLHTSEKDSFNMNWNVSEKLSVHNNMLGRFISKHTRIDDTPVEIYHFWVKIDQK